MAITMWMAPVAAVALVAVMAVPAPRATAAQTTSNCAAKLLDPCSPYTNKTGSPPDTCCGPLKHAAAAVVPAVKTPDADAAAQATPATPQLFDGWPAWLLDNVPPEALQGIVPKSVDDAYDKMEKVGEGSYSRVYRARERGGGGAGRRVVALKKVHINTSDSESVRFMAREMQFQRRLDHRNVMKLEGVAASRRSVYLVLDFMNSDLGWLVFRSGKCLAEPQIKWYMQQLLEGLQHCHERGILHLDIKPSNMLIDRHGVLKIGDFGLASEYGAGRRQPDPDRVVSLSYRAPELLLGSTSYGVGVDLWSAGCLLAEMFFGKTLLPGSGKKDQLLKIFALIGSPPDDYWQKVNLSPSLKPPGEPYNSTTTERFRDLPPSAIDLLATLLALDPAARGTAEQALQSSFFSTPPLPCDMSAIPAVYNRDEEEVGRRKRRLPVVNIFRKKPGAPLNLFQEYDGWSDDESTDAVNSGQEPLIDTGNPGQKSASANASSSAHDGDHDDGEEEVEGEPPSGGCSSPVKLEHPLNCGD